METVELRPLSLGELLDRTFRLYRNHFWLFVSIMAVPAAFSIPANVLILSLQGSMINSTAAGKPPFFAPSPGVIAGAIIGYIVFAIVFGTVYSIAVAAATTAVSDVYLGRAISIRGAYGKVRGRFWKLIGTFLNILLRILGIFLLVVVVLIGGAAGIGVLGASNPILAAVLFILIFLVYIAGLVFCCYFALRYAVFIPVVMLENLGAMATIRRTVFLTKGRRGHIFLTLLVAGIIAYAGVVVFQLPFLVSTVFAVVRGHFPPWLAFASSASGAVGSAITGPISMIAIVLLYYDARIRKEAFDLQFMMASLDAPAPSPGAVSPA
jgi:glycerophosphoryl diester phosphodiesterase family protein